ncbi:hypothetical protein D2V93_01170 [Flagellimonas taeanensis]|uniref:hypothetical protein n=1 Tax=Flavobacteriaceae TaxID=49546 RepID=UPI000E697BCE|nr:MULTISPECIES: hypothetical protein [Allomuricauda]MDC6384839.1 hypothetical protein [Muricauda sp. SK9]RIV53434.1 hypothetical protein D2V93_01170 [Allomuricauda taeanensis]
MKKAFNSYFLPLCVLLLGGFINLYADSQYDSDPESACFIQYEQDQCPVSSIGFQHLELEKKHYAETEVGEKEEKDEETSSYNPDLGHGSYLTAFFYVPIGEQYTSELGTNPGHLTLDSSIVDLKRHIRFQVFRI